MSADVREMMYCKCKEMSSMAYIIIRFRCKILLDRLKSCWTTTSEYIRISEYGRKRMSQIQMSEKYSSSGCPRCTWAAKLTNRSGRKKMRHPCDRVDDACKIRPAVKHEFASAPSEEDGQQRQTTLLVQASKRRPWARTLVSRRNLLNIQGASVFANEVMLLVATSWSH